MVKITKYKVELIETYEVTVNADTEDEAIETADMARSQDQANFVNTKHRVSKILSYREKLEINGYPGRIPEEVSKEEFINFAVKHFREFDVKEALGLAEIAIRGARQSLYTSEQFAKIVRGSAAAGFSVEQIKQDIFNEYLR